MAFPGRLYLERGLGSDASTPGSVFLCLLGRYEREAHKCATLEKDFVVLKKVRVGSAALPEPRASTGHRAQSWAGRAGGGRSSRTTGCHTAYRDPLRKWDVCVDTGGPQDKI